MENYRKSVADANRAKAESDRADALLAGRAAAANRPPAKGAGQGPTDVQLVNNIAAEYISKGMSPVAANARATRELIAAKGTKAVTSNVNTTTHVPETDPRAVQGAAKLNATQNDVLSKHMDSWEDSTEARKAKKTGTYDALYKAEYDKKYSELLRGVVSEAPPPVNLRGTTSAPRTSTPPPPPDFVLNRPR